MIPILLGAALLAAPALGVDEPPRRGTFVETSLGVFTALGGSRALSGGQPAIAMTVGRELGPRAALFASLGIGAASASCYQLEARSGTCLGADSFGTTFLEGGGAYGFALARRSLLSLKVLAGVTDLSPSPVGNGSRVADHLVGFHAGIGGAFDYDTHLDHFAVGLDALLRYTLSRYTGPGGNSQTLGLPSLAVMPRIRYVF